MLNFLNNEDIILDLASLDKGTLFKLDNLWKDATQGGEDCDLSQLLGGLVLQQHEMSWNTSYVHHPREFL